MIDKDVFSIIMEFLDLKNKKKIRLLNKTIKEATEFTYQTFLVEYDIINETQLDIFKYIKQYCRIRNKNSNYYYYLRETPINTIFKNIDLKKITSVKNVYNMECLKLFTHVAHLELDYGFQKNNNYGLSITKENLPRSLTYLK